MHARRPDLSQRLRWTLAALEPALVASGRGALTEGVCGVHCVGMAPTPDIRNEVNP